MLQVERVTHSYGRTVALKECSLRVLTGEMMVLLGPSGCGKSTLLQVIAGAIDPSGGGRVLVDDRDLSRVPVRARGLAYVMEGFALYPHLSVRGNIEYPLRMQRLSRSEVTTRAAEIANLLDITDQLDRRPHELSLGQKQRVAVARAAVRDINLLCADEPFANLDAPLRRELRIELKRLQSKRGATWLVCTHSQSDALAIGDRIAVMNEGCIVQVGTAHELYSKPATRFVAEFVGEWPMNFVSLVVQQGEARLSGKPIGRVSGDRRDEQLDMGFRPAAASVATSGGLLNGTLEAIESVPPEYMGHIRVGTDRLAVEVSDRQCVGDQVCVEIDLAQTLLFDPSSGHRISAGLLPL